MSAAAPIPRRTLHLYDDRDGAGAKADFRVANSTFASPAANVPLQTRARASWNTLAEDAFIKEEGTSEPSSGCSPVTRGSHLTNCVSVSVRVRPVPAEEPSTVWAGVQKSTEARRSFCIHRGHVVEEYEFTHVFFQPDDNRRVFEELQGSRLSSSVFSGVNETVFAYGQTGSGKTHTIFGSREEPGLLQLFVQTVFARAAKSPGSTVHVCCYEIAGDAVADLVDADSFISQGNLRAEDIAHDELFIKTRKCRYQIVKVKTIDICLGLLQKARQNRAVGVSSCNLSSSRTHALVQIFVQNPIENQTEELSNAAAVERSRCGRSDSSIGALTLVDLAGTEKEHENPTVQGRQSARLLNTSLSSLNRLLRKLQSGCLDESERRQSVLNKCLWEYLRPGCGIAMIFCVNPLLRHQNVTLSTLAMASDSRKIQSHRKAHYVEVPMVSRERPASTPSQNRFPQPTPSGVSESKRNFQATEGVERREVPAGENNGVPAGGRGAVRHRWSPVSEPTTPRHVQQSRDVPCPSAEQNHAPRGSPEDRCLFPPPYTLERKNCRLERKLHRCRARSQELALRVRRVNEKLSSDNAALLGECRSLRTLLLQQRQQQLVFLMGSSVETIGARDFGRDSTPLGHAGAQFPNADSDEITALKRERDYWRTVATELKIQASCRADKPFGSDAVGGTIGDFLSGDDTSAATPRSLCRVPDFECGHSSEGTAVVSAVSAFGNGVSSSPSSSPSPLQAYRL